MQEWISSPIGMHPVESGQWVLAADVYAERDRLVAELAAANATLDRLREVRNGCVQPKCSSQEDYADLVQRLESILYPETNP